LVNETELSFYTTASTLGFKVLRNGYPDFALEGPNGPFFVEVKQGQDVLSATQREMITFLAKAGFPTYLANGGKFPKLENPIVQVNERMPRCDQCIINIDWERMKNNLNEALDNKYRTKWNAVKTRAFAEYRKNYDSWKTEVAIYDKLLRNAVKKYSLISTFINDEDLLEHNELIIGAIHRVGNFDIQNFKFLKEV